MSDPSRARLPAPCARGPRHRIHVLLCLGSAVIRLGRGGRRDEVRLEAHLENPLPFFVQALPILLHPLRALLLEKVVVPFLARLQLLGRSLDFGRASGFRSSGLRLVLVHFHTVIFRSPVMSREARFVFQLLLLGRQAWALWLRLPCPEYLEGCRVLSWYSGYDS